MSAAVAKVNKYLGEPFLGRKEIPLLWWRNNEFHYPLLTRIVKKI